MGRKLLILFLLLNTYAISQEIVQRKLFSDAVGINIRKYKKQAKIAYLGKDYERAQFLFDSLVGHVINNSYMDNFTFRKHSGRKVELHKFENPIFLITSASWIATGEGEIPALNSIAENYGDQIDFVVLFWGSKKKLRKIRKKYSKNINILFVDERENTYDLAVRSMKHSLGFPTSFLIDAEKKILDVRRNVHHHYYEGFTNSFNQNYQTFMSGVSLLLKVDIDPSNGLIPNDRK